MAAIRPRVFSADRPSLDEEPRFFTQTPDDLDEDGELSARPGPSGILRAILRLIRRSGSRDRSIVCTYADIAEAAGVSVRTVKTHAKRLVRLKYLSRETVCSGVGFAARKSRFTVTYNLRPNLQLESDPVTISGSQSFPRVKKSSPSRVKKSSPSRVKKSSPSTLFEQRHTTEEKTTTTDVVESSPSFSDLPSSEKPPTPLVPLDLVEVVKRLWPNEPLVERRLAYEVLHLGEAEGRLAIEYAELMGAKGLIYAIRTADRWYRDGYDLSDCEAEVRAQRPKPSPMAPPTPARPKIVDLPPTPDEIAEAAAMAMACDGPFNGPLIAIKGWVKLGYVSQELVDEIAAGAKKNRPGVERPTSPPAGGVHSSEPECCPVVKGTVNRLSRQGFTQALKTGQRARLDSNQEPSDSKDAGQTGVDPPASSAILAPSVPPDHPDSRKTHGVHIRGFPPS